VSNLSKRKSARLREAERFAASLLDIREEKHLERHDNENK
jgi:hypothetical protein